MTPMERVYRSLRVSINDNHVMDSIAYKEARFMYDKKIDVPTNDNKYSARPTREPKDGKVHPRVLSHLLITLFDLCTKCIWLTKRGARWLTKTLR